MDMSREVSAGCATTCRSRALAIVDRLSAVQSNGLAVKIREDDVQDSGVCFEPADAPHKTS